MATLRKFTKGVAWMALGNWTEQAVNLVVFIILARMLGAESFGLVAMASVLVVLSEYLVRESLSEYLIAERDPDPRDVNAVFVLLVGLGILLALALAALAWPAAAFYGRPSITGIVLALLPTVPMIAITAVPVALLRRELRFGALAARAVAGVIAGGIVGIAMAGSGYGVWALVGQRLAQVATNVVLAWGAAGWRPSFDTDRARMARVLGFGGKVLGLRAAELASTQAPIVVIGAALGPVASGYYSVAWRLVEMLSILVVTPLRMASQPAFAALNRDGVGSAGLLRDITRMSGLVAFPVFVGLAVLAHPILRVVFGPQWVAAAPILVALSAVGTYFCIEKVQQAYCLAAGQAGRITAISWGNVALITASALLLQPFGLTAVALGLVASYLVLWPLRLRVVAGISGYPVSAQLMAHAMPALGSALMAAAVLAAMAALQLDQLGWSIVFGVATGVAVFALFTLAFMRDRLALIQTYISGEVAASPALTPAPTGTVERLP